MLRSILSLSSTLPQSESFIQNLEMNLNQSRCRLECCLHPRLTSTQHSTQSFSSDSTATEAPLRLPISTNKHLSFLSMSPPSSPAPNRQPLCFPSPQSLLNYVTRNWQENFVTSDLDTRELVDLFVRRPFFLLLSIDAPLYERFRRSKR